MGLLVDGQWVDQWYDTEASGGKFQRKESSFRDWVTADGSSDFPAEAGRYHLYVAWACPWAHRTLLLRKLKGLEEIIGLSVVDWYMGEQGWTFRKRADTIPDTVNGARHLHQVYTKADPAYTGRVTVPVLWDKERSTVVNNESSEIDEINETVYHNVNNGVYKSGFASTQGAYEEAVTALFDTLDMLDERLSGQRYLVGNRITEADWRLFTTLVRFDPVYHGHFKCNVRRIVDYPNLFGYLRDLYQVPGVAETVNFRHITNHYYQSHETVNPTRVVAVGPDIDLSAPHDRARFG